MLRIFTFLFNVIIADVIDSAVVVNNVPFRLDILHYNDFHARFEETSVAYPLCRTNDNSCLGGFARLYAELTLLLREKPQALLLNAGDNFQGTYWYTLLKWNVTQQFMNLLPHDAYALGNHEFDDGPAGLAPYLAGLKAPVLVANMDTSQEPLLQGLYRPHIVVERGGRKIGIFGLIATTTKLTATPGQVNFTDERQAARREAATLVALGVDIVVLLSHCGFDVDQDIAANYGENIDIIVGGHSHSLLWNGPSPSGDTVVDTYPVVVQPSANSTHKVLIVQANAFSKFVGNLTVWFNSEGEFQSWEGGPIFLNRSIPEDETIKKMLAPYTKDLHAKMDVVVGESDLTMESAICGFGECELGDLFCDAMLELSKQKYPSTVPHIAFAPRSHFRERMYKGPITRGAILTSIPLYNTVQTFLLQGQYVLEALESGAREAWMLEPWTGPRVLHVSGMKVVVNATEPAGKRIMSTFVQDQNQQLDPNLLYRVTTVSFVMKGSGGFQVVPEHAQNVITLGVDAVVLEEYIKNHSPLHITLDGRLTIVH